MLTVVELHFGGSGGRPHGQHRGGRVVARSGPMVLAVADTPDSTQRRLGVVDTAAAAGARLVDLGIASAELVAAIRDRHPDVIVFAESDGADVRRDVDRCLVSGATLLCGDPGMGLARGVRRDAILVSAEPWRAASLIAAGWPVVADVDVAGAGEAEDRGVSDDAPAGVLAAAAVCAWLGAPVLRTRYVRAVSQAIDMVESIRGRRPPAWTRRALA